MATRIQVLIPDELKRRSKIAAVNLDLSLGQLVCQALEDYLDRVAPEPSPEPPTPRRGKNSKP